MVNNPPRPPWQESYRRPGQIWFWPEDAWAVTLIAFALAVAGIGLATFNLSVVEVFLGFFTLGGAVWLAWMHARRRAEDENNNREDNRG